MYQLLALSRIPASAAIDTSVELAKRRGLKRLAPVVNGLLRSALPGLASREAAPLVPGPMRPIQVAAACSAVPGIDLRVNALRCVREQLLLKAFREAQVAADSLAGLPWELTLLAHAGDLHRYARVQRGALVRAKPKRPGSLTPAGARAGAVGAGCPCVAPGGKTTHLAELMGGRGTVWAVDRSAERLRCLEANASRLGPQDRAAPLPGYGCLEPARGTPGLARPL